MTKCNDTEIKVYDQLMQVRMCIDAFKDIYENIPDEKWSGSWTLQGEAGLALGGSGNCNH